ncbi:MAG: acyl-CoA dehydrogenase family protein, partial [Clostridiales bacterium]|nr:acyl-CoA dehydrogenase family protein [Clostridiales bacterium]
MQAGWGRRWAAASTATKGAKKLLFDLTPEQQLVQKLARDFAQNEVAPIAAEIDRDSRFPQETVDKLFRYGFFGICCP